MSGVLCWVANTMQVFPLTATAVSPEVLAALNSFTFLLASDSITPVPEAVSTASLLNQDLFSDSQ